MAAELGVELIDAVATTGGQLGAGLGVVDPTLALHDVFATPLIGQLVADHDIVVTLEEGAAGGFGAHVLSFPAATGRLDGRAVSRAMTLPDRCVAPAAPDAQDADAGLAAADIEAAVLGALDDAARGRRRPAAGIAMAPVIELGRP